MASEGGGFDFNKLAQSMGLGMGGNAPNPDAPAKDMDEMVSKLFDQMMKIVGKFTNINTGSLLSTGVFAHADITKAGVRVDSMMTQGLIPDARGGTLANIAAEGTQIASVRDFSKVGPSSGGEAASYGDIAGITGGMENYRGASMSESSFGDLVPNISAGQARSAGMDFNNVG